MSIPIIPAPMIPYRHSSIGAVGYGDGTPRRCRDGPLAFGCWRFTHDHIRDARTALHAATDALRMHLDRADCYRVVVAPEGQPLP